MKNKIRSLLKYLRFNLLFVFLFIAPMMTILAWGTLSLQTWDLVDSGKHLDYKNNSSYSVSSGVTVWNNYKSGVIRADTILTANDVTYSDVNSLGGDTVGRTSSNGTIKFAHNYMSTLSTNQKLNVIIHETGHALRLNHRNESDSVMQEYVTSITTLSLGDKRNYDWAYNNYY